MSGKTYRFVGGPFDGQVRTFHEGNAFVGVVNVQPDPGGTPVIGHVRYSFGLKQLEDGIFGAYYLGTDLVQDTRFPKKVP